MTREEKNVIVNTLAEEFKVAGSIVVVNYKGSTHRKLEALRAIAKEADVKVQVAKNTFVNVALKNVDLPQMDLKSESMFIWANDQISACKIAEKFASENKDTFVIKGGIIDGQIADTAKVMAFAKLPGREELLGMLASVWMGPIRNFTIGLDALRRQKEETAA
jgi:large subunit ribosomal protein L10